MENIKIPGWLLEKQEPSPPLFMNYQLTAAPVAPATFGASSDDAVLLKKLVKLTLSHEGITLYETG